MRLPQPTFHRVMTIAVALIAILAGSSKAQIYLEQNWTRYQRSQFYYTPQGSQMLPYRWFLYLATVQDENQLFRSDTNMRRFGYLPDQPSEWNEDGLSVGLARHFDEGKVHRAQKGLEWVGPTCAFCHTAEIEYRGDRIRIDGGPAIADFQLFFGELVEALGLTLSSRFDAFARKVLGPAYDETAKDALRAAVEARYDLLRGREERNTATHPPGPGRVDAFGMILNEVLGFAMGDPENVAPPDAPVSYPQLWGSPQSDRAQWTGNVDNTQKVGKVETGVLGRNVGQVLGVFGEVEFDCCLYESSAKLPELRRLERLVESLRSPPWPRAFPAPVKAKYEAGRTLYGSYCESCHALVFPGEQGLDYTANLTGVRTDPAASDVILSRVANTNQLRGRRRDYIQGPKFGPRERAVDVFTHVVSGVVIPLLPGVFARTYTGVDPQAPVLSALLLRSESDFEAPIYKARPLKGIWATGPYLHNGSVRTLRDLLTHEMSREKRFRVGSREFDVYGVGLVNEGDFMFDTTLPGNCNRGHDFGTHLSSREKSQLIEFLKTL